MELSLEEYITRKNAADSVCLLDMRKKHKNIEQANLDKELDDYMESMTISGVKQEKLDMELDAYMKKKSPVKTDQELDKLDKEFDAYLAEIDNEISTQSLSHKSRSNLSKLDRMDIDNDEYKPTQKLQTELKKSIGFKGTQQWRLDNVRDISGGSNSGAHGYFANRDTRKMFGSRNFKGHGYLHRGYTPNQTNNFSGNYKDRGNFIYKFQTGRKEITGIVRNKKPYNRSNAQHLSEPIQINVNFESLMNNGPKKYAAPPNSPTSENHIAREQPDTLKLQKDLSAVLMEYLQARQNS